MQATPPVLTARAVLLDMDGTIVNSDAVVERCWRAWALRQGLDPVEVLKVVHGRQGHATMAILLHMLDRFPTIERTLVMVQAEVADRLAAVPG
ncbi:HAD family hydrolase, partial [Streptomyces zhihengii]